MGLFDFLFKNRPKPVGKYEGDFKMLDGYRPHFTTFGGSIYESELIRAAINARATHVSKLKIEMLGAARPGLRAKMQHAPNQFMTWSQFMYRLSTLLDVHNTAFICPIYDQFGKNNDLMQRFEQFKQTVQGDPKQIVQQMLNRGQITQDQFNRASQIANQMMRFMK